MNPQQQQQMLAQQGGHPGGGGGFGFPTSVDEAKHQATSVRLLYYY